tara:strand:+ start:156 stop:383 length:228 start_codon:yes stop_codon:yes gene_type:complete
MNNKTMDLTNIIHLYSLISSVEDDKHTPLPQDELKALNWKPQVVQRKPINRMSTEKFLDRNLGDFFRYMIDYSEI